MQKSTLHCDGKVEDMVRGAVAGLVAGLAASWLMEQFQAGYMASKATLTDEPSPSSGDSSTVKAAEAIARNVADTPIPRSQKAAAGELMHYAMGGGTGAIYGALAEVAPVIATGEGGLYGAAVWATADNAAVPALGLTPPPTQTPLSTHAYALASHLVYGVSLDAFRRVILAVI
ncbi:MAG: hypothetical protein JWM57_336 [Phycisphaerales bacterium]|nr:hypothetical protein [Phycisphaerales bacterium]